MTKEHDSPRPTPASSESEIQTTIMPRGDLGALGLSARACKILSRAGVSTKSQLVNLWQHGDMRCIWELDLSDIRQVRKIVVIPDEETTIEQIPIGKPTSPQSAESKSADSGTAETKADRVESRGSTKSLDDGISILGLTERIDTSLHIAGIKTMSQLTSLGLREILDIPGISLYDLQEIESILVPLRGKRIGIIAIANPVLLTNVPLNLTSLHELDLNEEITERLDNAHVWSVQDLIDCTEGELQSIIQVGQNVGLAAIDIELIKDKLNTYLLNLLSDASKDLIEANDHRSQIDFAIEIERNKKEQVNVRALREELGLTPWGLARILGVHHMTINNWEQGRSSPNEKNLKSLLNLVRQQKNRPEKVTITQEGQEFYSNGLVDKGKVLKRIQGLNERIDYSHEIRDEEHNNLKIELKALDEKDSRLTTSEGKLKDMYLINMGIPKNDYAGQRRVMEYLDKVPIEVLALSALAHNRLIRGGIRSLGELLASTWKELTSIWYMGQKSLNEIAVKLDSYLSSHPIIDNSVEVDVVSDASPNGRIAEPSLIAQLQNAKVQLDKINVDALDLLPAIKTELRKANILTIQELCNNTEDNLCGIQGIDTMGARQIRRVLNSFLAEIIFRISDSDQLYELAGELCKIFESHNLLVDIRLPSQARENLSEATGSKVETLADLQQAVAIHYSTIGIVYIWLKPIKRRLGNMWLVFKRRLLYPLSKIVRRIRKNMEVFYVAVAGTFIPIGFMAVVIAKEFESAFTQNSLVIGGALVAFVGVGLLLAAMWLTWQREKREGKKENWEINGKVLQMDVLAQLLSEIKGLREDLKGGDKNGRSKNNPV